jgi:1-acyl-sn-glycerol-3-phosphate acyltransferase
MHSDLDPQSSSRFEWESPGLVKFWLSVGRFVWLTGIFVSGALDLTVKRPATHQQRAEWLHQFCARVVSAMGISMRVEGSFPEHGVVVSNHMGYLDIMVFAAQHRCVFVSKAELAKVPLLGWMTTMAGTVYVERGRGGSAISAKSGLEAVAVAGLPIVIFPEGTTSNGSGVLPFRSGALAMVLEVGQSVTAACVSYRFTEDNGPNVTIGNDLAFWGDDARLFHHIFALLALRGIEVKIRIADKPIAFSAGELHRKQAAIEARAAVMDLRGLLDTFTAAP